MAENTYKSEPRSVSSQTEKDQLSSWSVGTQTKD